MTHLSKLPTKISAGLGLSMIDRAVKESFATRCSLEDLAKVKAYFEKNGEVRCFYCDAPEPARWDHLHAVSRGGDTMPGNLVPACGRCDDSKQARDVEAWARSKSKHRPSLERLPTLQAQIEAYQRHFGYDPGEFEQKLSQEQRDRYRLFRAEIDSLRAHLESADLLKGAREGVGQ